MLIAVERSTNVAPFRHQKPFISLYYGNFSGTTSKHMSANFPFTVRKIQELPTPEKGRVYYKDEKKPGLQLCVTSAGTKTFYYVRRINGMPTRVRLGALQNITLEQARAVADRLAGTIAEGRNPQAERQNARQSTSLQDLFDYWIAGAKLHKRSWPDDVRIFEKYLVCWHKTDLASITLPKVSTWHNKIAIDHGPVQANRCKALLSTLFSRAEELGYSGPNPCKNIKNFPEHSRERYLLPDEMKAFLCAVEAEEPIWRDFFLLCLLTGQRRGNVASMRWDELDLTNAVWTVPADKAKAKKPITVALSPRALEILLQRRQVIDTDNPWVFPGRSRVGHVLDPKRAWARLLARANIQNLHVHDLRRTLGSWQAALGTSLLIIGKSLGHNDLKSTQVYSRLDIDPVRESVTNAANAMFAAAGEEPTQNQEETDI
jgi:integrase